MLAAATADTVQKFKSNEKKMLHKKKVIIAQWILNRWRWWWLVLEFVLNPISVLFFLTQIPKIELKQGKKTNVFRIGSSFDTCNQNARIFASKCYFSFFSSSSLTEKQSNGSVHFDQQNISAVNKMSSKIRNLCICRRCCCILFGCRCGRVSVCVYACMCARVPVHVSYVYAIYKYTYCLGAFAA